MERALVFVLMHYIYSTNMCCNCEANFNDIVKHLNQNSDVKYRNSYGDFLDGRLYFSRRVQNHLLIRRQIGFIEKEWSNKAKMFTVMQMSLVKIAAVVV